MPAFGNPVFLLTSVALVAALLFGGGTRQALASDIIPQVLALPLLAVLIPRLRETFAKQPVPILLLGALLLLPILQLIPLPPFLWNLLPGRADVHEILKVTGGEGLWRPISLLPAATERAIWALLPPIAIFLGIASLDQKSREQLVLMAVAIAIISVFVATMQTYGASQSTLYFYAITSVGRGVGFFANPNHQAAFLYMLMPLAAAVLSNKQLRLPVHPLILLTCVCAAMALGLSLTGSRSALILGIFALAYVVWTVKKALPALGKFQMLWLGGGIAVLLTPLALGMGLLTILRRFDETDVAEDARWMIAANTWRMIKSYFPFGGGVGTFEQVYPLNERYGDLISPIINRAHNDLLEFLYEGGIASAILLVVFAGWFVGTILSRRREADKLFSAGLLSILLLCIHSLWDYPLRTAGCSVIFALACALLLPAAAPYASPTRRTSHRTRKTASSRPVAARPVAPGTA